MKTPKRYSDEVWKPAQTGYQVACARELPLARYRLPLTKQKIQLILDAAEKASGKIFSQLNQVWRAARIYYDAL